MSAAAVPLRRGARLSTYVVAARVAARQALTARGEIVGRAGFLAAILLIYSRLWRVVPLGGAYDVRSLLWYLAITEWVLLSTPMVHLEIERDVRTGDVAYLLPRPVSFLGMRVAESLGALGVRLVGLGIVALPTAYLLAGGFPADPWGLPLAAVLGVLGGAFGVVVLSWIGVLAVWLQDVSPVYWVWQKAAFVLGGLILPITMYPAWLRDVAAWSPFSVLLYGPGRMAFGFDPAAALGTVGLLLGWGALATWLLAWTHRRALRVLDVNGG